MAGKLNLKEFTLVHPPICYTLKITLLLTFSTRSNQTSIEVSQLVLILQAQQPMVWLPVTLMKLLEFSNWKTLQEGLFRTWSKLETHGTKIITVDLGQIVTQDGLMHIKLKSPMLRTPMMEPSSWTQTPSRLPSTISKSIINILTGITTISTDFHMIGEKAAELVLTRSVDHIPARFYLTLRNSL